MHVAQNATFPRRAGRTAGPVIKRALRPSINPEDRLPPNQAPGRGAAADGEHAMKCLVLSTTLTVFLCLPVHAAWLGAELDNGPDAPSTGVLVRGVAEGSPAARAGLKQGDVI